MINIKIDRDSGAPLYAQIRDSIKKALNSDILKPGDRLPTVAALSKDLGVTACTIRRAFDDLTKEGLTHCHVGRGTFINDPLENKPGIPDKEKEKTAFQKDSLKNIQLNSLIRLIDRDGLIRFTSGSLNPDITKNGILERAVKDTFKNVNQKDFQTAIPQGKESLRVEIAKRYKKRGIEISPEQILVTGGSQQAVFLMAQRAFLRKHRILFETPWFSGISNTFKAFNHNINTVPRDLDGPIPQNYRKFDNTPSTFYVCPIFNNPMGTSMKPRRKKEVIEWTRENGGDLISDEVYYELYYDNPPESFADEIKNGNVAVASSISKSFMFGMRLGWIAGTKQLIDELIPLKRTIDMGVPSLVQETCTSLFKSGEYDSNLENIRSHYRTIRNLTIEALEKYMPEEVSWSKPEGGLHIWVELPEGFSSVDTYMTSVEKGVAILPGPILDPDNGYTNAFRLSYGSVIEKEIEPGIKILSEAVKENLLKKPCSSGICTDETDFRY